MKKNLLQVAFLFFFLQHGLSQNSTMDSLKAALQNATEDTTRLRIYLELGHACEIKDNMLYAEPAFRLVDKLLSQLPDDEIQHDNTLIQEARAYNLVDAYYSGDAGVEWEKIVAFTKKRLRSIEETGNKKRIAETLMHISGLCFYNNDTTGYLENAQKSVALFIETRDAPGAVGMYNSISRYYQSVGYFVKSLESIHSAIAISKELHYIKGEAISLAALADLYRDNGEDEQAFVNYQSALSILNNLKDTNELFNVIAAVGGYYFTKHNLGKAIEYYSKLLELCSVNKGMDHDAGSVYKWIGMVYKDNNDFNNASINLNRSLMLFDSAKNIVQFKYVLDEIGSLYNKDGNLDKAIQYHLRAFKITDSLKWEYGKAGSAYLLALDYYSQKNYKQAKEYNDPSLAYLKKQFEIKLIIDAELLASRIDSAQGDNGGAFSHFKEYISLSNKLKGEEIRKGAQIEKFQNEVEKQKTEQEKKDAIAKRTRNLQYIAIGAFLLLGIFLFYGYIQKNSAKKKIEKAYTELKSTQAQLIQSEKMASLGQLTAGIAHEIQNPLNFVNNFSDINKELLTELTDEANKGNISEVKVIANDIMDNEEKINHHGKRADSIVKGMLQHSRSSTGIKEPTNINALSDEYLRLAYHGLRGKDNSFNVTMKTDFDETIGKINIVPQDIGRVLLNLYNNAFYAVNEKKKRYTDEYEPTVLVSTKKIDGKIEVEVKDNGTGIPQSIVDKIFQPFFTTKPTGQGTGLGLSLAYDIVKAQGGEIKVETKEAEGSGFIVQLPIA